MRGAVGGTDSLDAIRRGPPRRGLVVAEELGDLGVRQAGEVVVRHRLPLLARQRLQRVPQLGVPGTSVRLHAAGRGFGQLVHRDGAAGAGAVLVDRLAFGDRDQPRLDVAARPELGIGAHRGEERLRPGVVSILRAEHGPADSQDGRPVRGHDLLERRQSHVR